MRKFVVKRVENGWTIESGEYHPPKPDTVRNPLNDRIWVATSVAMVASILIALSDDEKTS